jgi:hypothetical protein
MTRANSQDLRLDRTELTFGAEPLSLPKVNLPRVKTLVLSQRRQANGAAERNPSLQ